MGNSHSVFIVVLDTSSGLIQLRMCIVYYCQNVYYGNYIMVNQNYEIKYNDISYLKELKYESILYTVKQHDGIHLS